MMSMRGIGSVMDNATSGRNEWNVGRRLVRTLLLRCRWSRRSHHRRHLDWVTRRVRGRISLHHHHCCCCWILRANRLLRLCMLCWWTPWFKKFRFVHVLFNAVQRNVSGGFCGIVGGAHRHKMPRLSTIFISLPGIYLCIKLHLHVLQKVSIFLSPTNKR